MKQATNYAEYLQINSLLNLQKSLSGSAGVKPCHDETLFIIVHQVYELLFKQILHELDSFVEEFSRPPVSENSLGYLVARLERVTQVEDLFIPLLEILETMSPMDFLEFRTLLVPASGFQSVQFRELEIKLGLYYRKGEKTVAAHVMRALNPEEQAKVSGFLATPSALALVEGWLERMPFIAAEHFDFWHEYEFAVLGMLAEERRLLARHSSQDPAAAQQLLQQWEETQLIFTSLFNADAYGVLQASGQRTLSQKATLGALFIFLYRHEAILHQPYRLLTALLTIDEKLTAWRYRHALMAHRLLGSKVGTGSSSGHQYLQKAAEHSRIFVDLFNLSTFLLPLSQLPKLPANLKKSLNFS